jgi:hypothetical protein
LLSLGWKNELEAIAMPMIESYDVILCETTPGSLFEIAKEEGSSSRSDG